MSTDEFTRDKQPSVAAEKNRPRADPAAGTEDARPRSPRSTISMRTATARQPAKPGQVSTKAQQAREQVEQANSARRQKVWDKLDAARTTADERQKRLRRFRGGGGDL